jgi:hypothetical protein
MANLSANRTLAAIWRTSKPSSLVTDTAPSSDGDYAEIALKNSLLISPQVADSISAFGQEFWAWPCQKNLASSWQGALVAFKLS